MIRIRFRRVGLKGQASYRIVVTDQRKSRDGAELEVIGYHNPRTRPATDEIKFDRALYWLSVGAQPSDAARRVLERTGTNALFERMRKGEAVETLVQEAIAHKAAQPPISPKTRYPSPAAGEGKQNKAKR